jgi:hypothetical protein
VAAAALRINTMSSNMASEEAMSVANKGLESPMRSAVTPSRELDLVRGILAKASPTNLAKYYKVMTDAGFDSAESLTIDLASFREVCPDILPGHAHAILSYARKQQEALRQEEPKRTREAGVEPAPTAVHDRHSIEKMSLAGPIPTFPVNAEDDEAKVHAWFVGVATWSRIWSIEVANACIHIDKHPDKPLAGTGIVVGSEANSYWGNSFVLAHQSDKSIMSLFTQGQKDCPKLTEILPVLASIYRSKDEDYVDKLRVEFINMSPCTQEWHLQQSLIAWKSLREELKARENEQGPKECLASLKRLLSGLPKIQALLESTEFTLQIKTSFDRMLRLAEGKAKEWVRIKPKNPKPNPSKGKKGDKAKEDSPRSDPTPNPTPNPTPTPTPTPTPAPNSSSVMKGSVGSGSEELRDCYGWVVSKYKCRHAKGAGHGLANDGISVCRFKHDPSKENSDPKEVLDHLATTPCKHGADCPHKESCLHLHP